MKAPGTESPSSVWFESIKLAVDAVRILIWPAIVVGAFYIFEKPILTIANELPEKFSAATKVGVGSLVLEIEQQAREAGNPQLAARIGKLSPEAIRHLMEMGESHIMLVGIGSYTTEYSLPDDKRLRAIRQLAANGLVEFKEDFDPFLQWIRSSKFRRVSSSNNFVPTSPLTTAEKQRLAEQEYVLNDLGKKAWQAILDAVLQQLREPKIDGSSSSAAKSGSVTSAAGKGK